MRYRNSRLQTLKASCQLKGYLSNIFTYMTTKRFYVEVLALPGSFNFSETHTIILIGGIPKTIK